MINFDDVTKENIKQHNPNWPAIPDHPYIILIIGHSGSRKTNELFNLINQKSDIQKIYTECPYGAKYKFFINKRESTGLKCFNGSKAFMEYSNDMNDSYKNIEENNQNENVKY